MNGNLPPALRLPMLVLGMAALVAGVAGGLARLAVDVPEFGQRQAGDHGVLMVAAFFATVISLERAVALRRLWAYLGPLCAGLGGAALWLGLPAWSAAWLLLTGAAVLTAASASVVRMQPTLFAAALALAAAMLVVGDTVWLVTASPSAAMPAWMAFLVMTIAGERLELTRLLPPRPAAQRGFVGILAVAIAGIATANDALFGLGLALLALWLLSFDIARRNVRLSGLPRFVAVCLLSGYGWLVIGGMLGMAGAFAAGHAWRDAALHAIFLGFVFSMVIGHAPIVIPAVMRAKLPYSPVLYVPLVALQASVLLRVLGGMLDIWSLRQWGGVANAAALALFVVTLLASVVRGRMQQRTPVSGTEADRAA